VPEAELIDIWIAVDNAVALRLRLPDGTELTLELAADSDAAAELLELLSRLASELLAQLGASELTITGFTPPAEDEE
jgi:hypothetical protein